MASSPLRYFFFQAEDGIRDVAVTGVQTCALPISGRPALRAEPDPAGVRALLSGLHERDFSGVERSEERRVGKECRPRGARDHERESIEREDRSQRGGVASALSFSSYSSALSVGAR